MILYRCIDKKEYEACLNGTYENLEKKVANIDYKSTNRIYKEDSKDNELQYVYFFPYYEPCERFNGEYIIRADIPEELLEHGIGSYANPISGGASFVILDEYRIKKEEFKPDEYIKEFHKINDEHEINWKVNEEYYKRVLEDSKKEIPLIPNGHVDMLDYSGVPHFDVTVEDELQPALERINYILKTNIKDKTDIKTKIITISDLKNERRFFEINNIPANFLKKCAKEYSVQEINQLFANIETPEQITETSRILFSGYIELNESECNVR